MAISALGKVNNAESSYSGTGKIWDVRSFPEKDVSSAKAVSTDFGIFPKDLYKDDESIKRNFGLTDEEYAKYKPYIDRHPFAVPGYQLGDFIRNGLSVIMSGRTAYQNDWWQQILKDYREGESAREANERQEAREDTSYQRTAKDAFAAGLNPWVLMQGGASPMSVNSSHKAATSKEDDASGSGNAFIRLLGILLLALTKGKAGGVSSGSKSSNPLDDLTPAQRDLVSRYRSFNSRY